MTNATEFNPPTEITYVDNLPTQMRVRQCQFVYEQQGQRVERIFDQDVITLGAKEDNHLVIQGDTVSRYHCKVLQDPDGYLLVDCASTNGTYINGVRIREAYLTPGCTVLLGKKEVLFYLADEMVPIVPSERSQLRGLIGQNPKMRAIYGIIERIAPTGSTVVIEGDTGTGKEVVARTIHALSRRSAGPLMVLDCSAIPSNLVESELFGHEKGAFTGAIFTRRGLFELADGGTLFLDELGELPYELQAKLLRVMEQREIRRVGASQSVKVDVRLLAATNRDLQEEVRAGRFRKDLYYRLSVVCVRLPTLRERPDDIPLLVDHWFRTRTEEPPLGDFPLVSGLDQETLALLQSYSWPGNVRELFNVIEYAASFAQGPVITVQDLPEQFHESMAVATPAGKLNTFKDAKERCVARFERDYLVALLDKADGNISQAAREAEIDRKHLRKLLRKHGIDASGEED